MASGYDGSIRIDTRIDTSGFNSGVAAVTRSFSGLSRAAGALGIALTATFAVKQLVKFGQEAVNIASDLEEVQNVVDTAFGEMAYMAEEFASTAIKQFGMSTLAAKQISSTYMAMSKGIGITDKAAAQMSIEMAKLSGDMASFYNVSSDVASTALKSVWTGETETLKQFGVVMTQTNLQQFAYTQGIKKKITAMTQAEQVQLRYKYVMSQLGMVQGDFEKTSGSWANQVRILSENWRELLGILGEGLIKVLTPVVQFLNFVVEHLIAVAKTVKSVISMFTGEEISDSNDSIAKSADNAAEGENNLAEGIKAAGAAAKQALANFDQLDVLQNNLGGGGSGGLGSFETPDFGNTAISLDKAKEKINDFRKDIDKFLVELKPKVEDFVIQPVLEPIIVPLPNPVYEPNWNLNPGVVPEPIFEPLPNPIYVPEWGLNNSLVTELGLVYATVENFGLSIQKSFTNVFNGLELIFTNAISNAELTYENMSSNIKSIGQTIKENTSSWVTSSIGAVEAWKQSTTIAVKDSAENMISNLNIMFETTVSNIANWINTTSGNFVTWGEGILQIGWDAAKGFASNFISGLKTAWDNFKEFVSATGEALSTTWNENKNWLVPTLAITGAIAVGAGIVLSGGSLLPALPAAAAAIPMLATGAVIPPNQEFMAILGDQKSGRNLEAPEGLIRQIIREELAGLQTGGGGDITVSFEGNLAQLGRVLHPVIRKEEKRIGTSLRTGGAF